MDIPLDVHLLVTAWFGMLILTIAEVPEFVTFDNGTSWILLSDSGSIDFRFDDGLVAWMDNKYHCINRINVDPVNRTLTRDSFATIVESDVISPKGLCIDWLNSKVYWTDSGRKTIEVSDLTGVYRKVLYWTHIYEPREIVVDPLSGFLFWIDNSTRPFISRAGMNGNQDDRSDIIHAHGKTLAGLAVDHSTAKLYWTLAEHGELYRSSLTGHNVTFISAGVSGMMGLDLHGDVIVWLSTNTKNVHVMNVTTPGQKQTTFAVASDKEIHGIAVLLERPPGPTNSCGGGNGGCSDLCLLSPTHPFYSCACPTGTKLKEDNKTCETGPTQQVLFVQRRRLGRISLDSPDFSSFSVPVVLDKTSHLVDVDYDPIDQYVYWTDEGHAGIKRSHLNGSGQAILFYKNVSYADGITVDFIHRTVYWTDRGKDTIEMGSLTGTHRHIVIDSDLDQPRAITVDPVKEWLFWTDWGNTPKIERSKLHGTDRTVIVKTDLHWPNGLTFDHEMNKLYWTDGFLNKIEVVNIDGTGRKLLIGSGMQHTFGLTVLGEYVYWTDWKQMSIERVNKYTGKDHSYIQRHLKYIYGIKAINTKLVCPHGSYGVWCGMKCGICLHGYTCTPATGQCPHGCGMGVISDPDRMCQLKCVGGTFGEDCSESCGQCRHGAVCDGQKGTCPHGCMDGYTGSTCRTSESHHRNNTSHHSGKVVSGNTTIVTTLIVAISIVVGISVAGLIVYFLKKWRLRRYQRAEDRVEFITEME